MTATPQQAGPAGPPAAQAQAKDPRPRAHPIHVSAGYIFENFDEAQARFAGTVPGFVYTRTGNPTIAAAEQALAALENAQDALLVASGQAAITLALTSAAGQGDHILASSSLYEGSRGLLLENLPRFGIEASFVENPLDPAAWARNIRPNTRAVFLESIPNALGDVPDLEAIAEIAHRHGVPVIVDNTLATPALLRPLDHGADVVVHSTSKALTGHGTVLGGAILSGDSFDWGSGNYPHLSGPSLSLQGGSFTNTAGPTRAFAAYLRGVAAPRLGPTASPYHAHALLQGLETLELRVLRQSESAHQIAAWLERQPGVQHVDHPGLPSHPAHHNAQRLLQHGAGSVFMVTLRGGLDAARAAHDALGTFTRMTHVGDVRSLVLHPASTTHTLRTPAERAAIGVHPGTLRLSIGLESPAALIEDLSTALDAAASATREAAPPTPKPTTTDRRVPVS